MKAKYTRIHGIAKAALRETLMPWMSIRNPEILPQHGLPMHFKLPEKQEQTHRRKEIINTGIQVNERG